ncbi:MAG: Ig-like domain-containing protein [Myxococcales bacterium]|nr:Ig-like domain-containing protein [Myxococcales bacterium]
MRTWSSRLSLLPALAALALVAIGCSDEGPQIRLQLSPDPRINSEALVAETIDSLRVTLDRPGGFAAAGAAFTLADVDDDGEDELVYTHPVLGSTLPKLRLVGGASIGDGEFQLGVVGLAGNEIAAVGGSTPTRFEPGDGRDVTLPLDLRPRYLPPRVVVSLPQSGQSNVPAALGLIYVELSKWVRPASVETNLELRYSARTGAEIAVPLALTIEDTTVVELGLREERTVVSARLGDGCKLAGGAYRLVVGTGVVDTSGNALDQDALSPGNDPFEASFEVTGSNTDRPCQGGNGCTDDSQCNPPGVTLYTCATSGPQQGRCLPAHSCDRVTCQAGHICAVGDRGPTCVPDCRVRFDCAAAHYCDSTTGLCRACSDTPHQDCRR